MYWNFESFLNAINTALDILSRIVGLAYSENTPVSFSKICKKDFDGPVVIMRESEKRWVKQMKDYRDCFVHYTPVDTMLSIGFIKYSDGWQIRSKLPTNPNVRDILGFRYSRKYDVLKYALSVFRNFRRLDNAIAKEMLTLYKRNLFPMRTNNLFFIGNRQRTSD